MEVAARPNAEAKAKAKAKAKAETEPEPKEKVEETTSIFVDVLNFPGDVLVRGNIFSPFDS